MFRKYIRPVKIGIKTRLEQTVLELAASIICAVFSYQGYLADIALLAIPCAIVSVVSFVLFLQNLYLQLNDWRSN
ncbi:hypothetical protein [Thalassotalea sp. Y01]|uniref:hypothetical protein n=1 Tax=Thalassotalea sp. Y01 TaxID=2729613 RepID=UPI00145DA211|nr:hypothetical protein [Thalassotalea sp. Y01]NMP15945.1 hypothetical protein [Thalassotalea sp. Y01]